MQQLNVYVTTKKGKKKGKEMGLRSQGQEKHAKLIEKKDFPDFSCTHGHTWVQGHYASRWDHILWKRVNNRR